MPGPPPPPPPPMGGLGGGPPPPPGPPPPVSSSGTPAFLSSITDPSQRKLKKVDPSKINDRSKPTVPGGNSSSANNSRQDTPSSSNFIKTTHYITSTG
jgi:hypothetical protein